jgi:ribonuclease J
MNVAKDLGYLKVPGGVLVSVDQLDELPDDEVVMVCTGSQGEPMAALARIANRDHKIRVHDQDTVLLASSVIPGNENSINRVINGLSRWGVNVIHTGNALVHVSGHAAAGELLYVYNIVKPANVMPVHGEVRHLIANAGLAVAAGVDPEHVILAEDGTVVDLKDGVAKIVGRVPCGYVFVDGASVGETSEGLLKDRRILSEEGFVSVFVAVNFSDQKIVAGPEVTARGFAEGNKVFDDVVTKIATRLEEALTDGVTDTYQLQQLIRRTTGKWVGERLRRRPMIVPVVVEA